MVYKVKYLLPAIYIHQTVTPQVKKEKILFSTLQHWTRLYGFRGTVGQLQLSIIPAVTSWYMNFISTNFMKCMNKFEFFCFLVCFHLHQVVIVEFSFFHIYTMGDIIVILAACPCQRTAYVPPSGCVGEIDRSIIKRWKNCWICWWIRMIYSQLVITICLCFFEIICWSSFTYIYIEIF